MDIAIIGQVVSVFSAALVALKQAADLLPEGPEKAETEAALTLAERELKIAEAQTASGLEYEICRAHFPPTAMLSKDEQNWKCPECGNQKYTGLQVGTIRW